MDEWLYLRLGEVLAILDILLEHHPDCENCLRARKIILANTDAINRNDFTQVSPIADWLVKEN